MIQTFAPTGLTTIIKRVRFKKPIQVTDRLILEVAIAAERTTWVDVVSVGLVYQQNDAGTVAWGARLLNNLSDPYEVDVHFATGHFKPVTSWSGYSTVKWRVRKVSNGNMAETRNDFVTADTGERIHTKVVRGTTGSAANTQLSVATGLNPAKVLSLRGSYTYLSGSLVLPFEAIEADGTRVAHVHFYMDSSGAIVVHTDINSNANVWSRPFKVVVEYEE